MDRIEITYNSKKDPSLYLATLSKDLVERIVMQYQRSPQAETFSVECQGHVTFYDERWLETFSAKEVVGGKS